MISGNPDLNLQLREYKDNQEAIELVRFFLKELNNPFVQLEN
jgi:hypothetical protein